MTTKEQERKALEKIRKIVEELGEGSYVGTAFEGCFEIAEENIANDWACSMKQKAEAAEKEAEYFHTIANNEANEIGKLEAEAETRKDEIYFLQNTVDDLVKQRGKAEEEALRERKEVVVETVDNNNEVKPFERIQFFNDNGFRFVNVTEKSGWTTSYKIEDLETFIIR